MTLQEIEKRVQALEDIEQIKQLHYRYIYALNDGQYDEIIDMFAEDMIEDGFPRGEKRTGKKEIAEVYRAMEEGARGKLRHTTIVAQPVISVEGDKAKGELAMVGSFGRPQSLQIRRGGRRRHCSAGPSKVG